MGESTRAWDVRKEPSWDPILSVLQNGSWQVTSWFLHLELLHCEHLLASIGSRRECNTEMLGRMFNEH